MYNRPHESHMGNRFVTPGLSGEATHGTRDLNIRKTGTGRRPSEVELTAEPVDTKSPKARSHLKVIIRASLTITFVYFLADDANFAKIFVGVINMELQYTVREYRDGDEAGIKSVLREAAFSNVWPGICVSVTSSTFKYFTAALVGVAVLVCRGCAMSCLASVCIPFLFVCFAHCMVAVYYVYGPPLFDLSDISGIYQSSDKTNFWVAETLPAQGKRIIGTIAVVSRLKGMPHSADVAYLRRMSVLKSCRRRGVANRLLDTAVQFCKECNYVQIELITTKAHQAAMQLYLKSGFYCRKYIPHYYLHGLVAIWTYELVYILQKYSREPQNHHKELEYVEK